MINSSSYTGLLDPQAGLEECLRLLRAPSTDYGQQVTAIHALGNVSHRQTCPTLLRHLRDEKLSPHVIIALAHTRDSRALFPLLNYVRTNPKSEIQQMALQYLHYTGDPRAESFLHEHLRQCDPPFADLAQTALKRCAGNIQFQYRYNGSEEEWKQAVGQQPTRHQALNTNLTSIKSILEEYRHPAHTRPQTYIIDEQGIMYIGGHLQEHVQVAHGQDVLAAGEIEFSELRSGQWKVDQVNHRSCGYYPAESCFYWVEQFFKSKSDVQFEKKKFEGTFPREGYNDSEFLSLFA